MSTPYFFTNRVSNWLLGLMLIGVMFALNLIVGWVLLGRTGLWLAFGLLVYGFLTFPAISSRRVMRAFGARAISLYEAPELWRMFQTLTEAAGLKNMVELYYLPSRNPNAFAVGGGNNSAICISDGLLRMMSGRELAGVLAHELTHIRNHDTKIMNLAQMIGRVNSTLSRIGLLLVLLGLPTFFFGSGSFRFLLAGGLLLLAPVIAVLLQLALSRSREFNADLGAAEITRDPMGLASALRKLEEMMQRGSWWNRRVRRGPELLEPTWLRTHPHTAERIARLEEIRRVMGDSTPTISANFPMQEFAKTSPLSRSFHLQAGSRR
jgi:heat shock protein HtpX